MVPKIFFSWQKSMLERVTLAKKLVIFLFIYQKDEDLLQISLQQLLQKYTYANVSNRHLSRLIFRWKLTCKDWIFHRIATWHVHFAKVIYYNLVCNKSFLLTKLFKTYYEKLIFEAILQILDIDWNFRLPSKPSINRYPWDSINLSIF